MARVKAAGSKKLFDSKILEMLTRTHPVAILLIYIPLCSLSLWYFHNYIHPSWSVMLLIFFTGIFSWTFFEYILHRFVFHWIGESNIAKKFHYYAHGVHHDHPRDKARLVMPPLPSLIIVTLFFLFFKLFVGLFVFAFFSGFMIGYLTYAMIHYSTHAFRPPRNIFKFLWYYHNLHHFKYPEKAFGVSSPLWDHIFGTVPPRENKKNTTLVNSRVQ